ncbi:MAG: methylenetetrahydrofolate reductase [Ardenticatenaceae bacterium]|nr:methylenetetrahydrofolate reductase [Ardenticatenaceae bacterium]
MSTDKMISGSNLERVLRAGHFAVTAELSPPDSSNPNDVQRGIEAMAGAVDAYNSTDASGAHCHMSSAAVSALVAQQGLDPVLQISCRDRNRISIQGDVLGAAALGTRNVLCLTGDDVVVGDHPEAKRVFDLDSIQLLRMLKIMRDKSMFLSGRPLTDPPRLFLGAAANPFAQPYEWRPLRLAKKVEAGADFIQTQFCFDLPRFKTFMKRVVDLGLHEKVYILAGVGPLRSARVAEYIRSNVPGVRIPDAVINRLKGAPKGKQKVEGKKICIEIIEQIKEVPGVHGVHIMAYKLESLVPEIVKGAGLWPRPAVQIPSLNGPLPLNP